MLTLSLGDTGRWSRASRALSSGRPGWKGVGCKPRGLRSSEPATPNSGGRGTADAHRNSAWASLGCGPFGARRADRGRAFRQGSAGLHRTTPQPAECRAEGAPCRVRPSRQRVHLRVPPGRGQGARRSRGQGGLSRSREWVCLSVPSEAWSLRWEPSLRTAPLRRAPAARRAQRGH